MLNAKFQAELNKTEKKRAHKNKWYLHVDNPHEHKIQTFVGYESKSYPFQISKLS